MFDNFNMGATGSSHMKVFGNCYDLPDDKQYYGNSNPVPALFWCIFFIATIVLLISNIGTSFKNAFLVGFMIFTTLCCIYSAFIHQPLSKWWFAKKNGTKVECPKPKQDCDDDAENYKNGGAGPYTCDDRFKYN